MRTTTLIYLFISVISFLGCTNEKDDDTIAPEMFMQQPTEGAVLKVGDEFHIEMHMADNLELKECSVSIIFEEEHKSETHSEEPWAYSRSFNCNGMKEFSIHEHIIVPDTVGHAPIAHGHYKFAATCTDASGNQVSDIVEFIID